MQVELVLKGVEMGRYGRERAEHKLEKAMERYHRELPVRVVVENHKGTVTARVVSHVNGRELVGQHASRSTLEALDEAIEKFERQLSRLNERQHQRGRRGLGLTLPTDGGLEARSAF